MVPDLTQSQVDATNFWEEGLWEELLAYIEEQRVIPIVGPDLLNVEVDGSRILLDRYIAKHLARKLSLPANLLSAEPSLNEIVCHFLRRNGRRERLYPTIRDIVLHGSFSPPKPLLQLAEICHLTLFVTTTFDSLLEMAINQVRFGGRVETATIAYTPTNAKDLECPKESLHRPTVYHLLGKLSASPDLCHLGRGRAGVCLCPPVGEPPSEESVRCTGKSSPVDPGRKFSGLAGPFLPAHGETAPSFRPAGRPRNPGRHQDAPRPGPGALPPAFQQSYPHLPGRRGRGIRRGTLAALAGAEPGPRPEQVRLKVPPPSEMPAGAIFISYARQDLAAVQELKARLDAAGLNVWFDFDRLGAGDAFELKIQKNIRNCSCFLAVLSRNTESRQEGFFRREWELCPGPGQGHLFRQDVYRPRGGGRHPDVYRGAAPVPGAEHHVAAGGTGNPGIREQDAGAGRRGCYPRRGREMIP